MPPATYEEDPNAAAARGYVYAYPPYGYPGQVRRFVLWPVKRVLTVGDGADGSADDAWNGPSPAWSLYAWSVHAAYALPYAPSEWYAIRIIIFAPMFSHLSAFSAMYPSTPMGQMPRTLVP